MKEKEPLNVLQLTYAWEGRDDAREPELIEKKEENEREREKCCCAVV